MDYQNAIDKLYNLLSEELTETVNDIESKPQTTRHNYSRYMGAITALNQAGLQLKVAADLLIKAGGNQAGIASALQVIGG